ncbi:MAG: hypothetical protein ACD_79C00176G0001 [uncultured bacterium]|nr:MAG: hypothetical protein ACD_79C00176G0001 [uncultured bacterium]
MNNLLQENINNISKQLSEDLKNILKWKWDSRFETVLSEFPVGSKENILNLLNKSLTTAYDQSSIKKAPVLVKDIDEAFGGLAKGQLLFTSDPNQDILIFCAWWPWGNGINISVRFSPFSTKLSDSQNKETMDKFRALFGV